ncbi:MAG: ankyrin repeat domain-containing protein, partial [Chlamydiota bacterium]
MRLFSGTAPNLNKSLSMEIDNKFIESVADRWLLKACQDEAPVQVLEYLVKVGADPNFLDSEGVSPLWEASRHANLEAMTFLLAAGADPNLGGFEGQSPLHGAVTSDKNTIEAIKLLLQHGANPNLKEIDGLTPEQIAKKEEREEVVAFFQNLKKQS